MRPFSVKETGDRLRYYVSSETNLRAVYLCDLLANGGQGECSCRDWICRVWPIIRKGGKTSCKHVRAARAHFLENLLATMAEQETRP